MLNTDANIKKLTNIFKENNFLFFYYYASLSKEMEFKIKTTLAEIKFRQLRLKKNFTKKLFGKKNSCFCKFNA